jgi:siroheme synthase
VLAFQDRFTVCVGAGVPVPVSASIVVEGWALLVNVSEAIAAPEVVGLNVTVNGTLLPVGIVTGSDRPPTLNTELFVLAAVTVTFAPLAVRLPDAVPLVPTTTLPRPSVVGATVNWPTAEVPVPVRASTVVEGLALLVNVNEAVAAPEVVGLKVTANGTLWPAGIVTGNERPPTLNSELFVLAAVTVTFAPLAVRLPEAVPLVPTTTLPRASVVGATVN